MKKLLTIRAQDFSGAEVSRFWNKVTVLEKADCWLWTGAKSVGYGSFACKLYNRQVGAHRISYALSSGECPAGMFVCHSCDNPACVNPSHLWLGTQLDNIRDRNRKGRQNQPLGEALGMSHLKKWDIIEIRHARGFHRDIAKDYGVSQTTITNIRARKHWTHIPEYPFA